MTNIPAHYNGNAAMPVCALGLLYTRAATLCEYLEGSQKFTKLIGEVSKPATFVICDLLGGLTIWQTTIARRAEPM